MSAVSRNRQSYGKKQRKLSFILAKPFLLRKTEYMLWPFSRNYSTKPYYSTKYLSNYSRTVIYFQIGFRRKTISEHGCFVMKVKYSRESPDELLTMKFIVKQIVSKKHNRRQNTKYKCRLRSTRLNNGVLSTKIVRKIANKRVEQ